MAHILKIIRVERKTSSKGKVYYRTHAQLDSGEISIGYGRGFQVGDTVEHFWHERWQMSKFRHKSK